MGHIGLTLALIVAAGVVLQWLSWWLKLPAILLLLAAGIVAGPLTGWLDPDALLGELLFPIASLGVAVILFEGSLTLRWHEVRGQERMVRNLVTIGALVTWLAIGAAGHWILDLPWSLALLLGALLTVTGPTVIVPLLRTVRPVQRVAHILRWEGIIIDPVGALLAVLVYEFILSGEKGHTLAVLGGAILIGGAIGLAGGWSLAELLRRHKLPEYLHNSVALAMVIAVFELSNLAVEESGLLAVTVMGILLANRRDVDTEDILNFKETLSILLISFLFIVLAARMDPGTITQLGWEAGLFFLVVILVVRPLMVAVSGVGSNLPWREQALIAWMAPRGIVAAAVSALFAIKLESIGIPESNSLVAFTFLVIVGTVVLQSLTARSVAQWLGVAEPEPRGVLIVGGNPVGRAIGEALHRQGFEVLLADSHWPNIQKARMAGLRTYYGQVVSEHADRRLDLVGIGHLLAVSQRPGLNALAAFRFRPEFGAAHVYALRTDEERDESEHLTFAGRYRPRRLFNESITFKELTSRLGRGYEIRATPLSESFGFEEYRARYPEALPMFALDQNRKLHIFSPENRFQPQEGWTLLSLVGPEDQEAGGGQT
ncbi:MAG: sodium:proton antiporter [Gammaproteobacteria bacterium]